MHWHDQYPDTFSFESMTKTTLVQEPLAESADLAVDLAARLCPDDCRAYHGMWQYFRLVGLIGTVGGDGRFLLDTFERLAVDGIDRVLIAGSADYGLLAHLLSAYRLAGRVPDVTVLDRCETPLALNRWYAEREGLGIRTVRADIHEYAADIPFDLVCTHSFLAVLEPARRPSAVRAWHAALRPGGWLVTTARVRHGAPDTPLRFPETEIAAFRARALALSRDWSGRLALTPDEIADAAEHYARTKRSYAFHSPDVLRDLICRAGFALTRFEGGGNGENNADRPSGPSREWRSERYRIVARKA